MRLPLAFAGLFLAGSALLAQSPAQPNPRPAYLDPRQRLDVRVRDLISRLTLAEKASLMENTSPGVPRLGIPRYDWWSEALHGVARAGHATVFPQAIGLAAMWDDAFLQQAADAIGTEGRAKFNDAVARDERTRFHGLTFWSPNVNIFRDPRWGRGQETYGEDPYLTGRMGVAFVRGLQGGNPAYLKVAACAKHFAVHSGPEELRHVFDVEPDPRDLHETYLPAFEALVREGRVEAVMTAYNAVYGTPCAENAALYDLLYRQWGFEGHVTSDCGAIADLYQARKLAPDAAAAEAMAVKAGLCLTCGHESPALVEAVRRRLIDESAIDMGLYRLLRTMFRLGFFDPPQDVPYAAISPAENDTPAHAALARRAAEEGIVLLKNDGLLPLRPETLHNVAVIGPNADSVAALMGNYSGMPSAPVTVLAGLKAALGPGVRVEHVPGCAYLDASGAPESMPAKPTNSDGVSILPDTIDAAPPRGQGFEAAVAAARRSDVVIFVGGYTAAFEGEEMKSVYADFAHGDRTRIELPAPQERLLEAVQATGKPVVLVLMTGSAVAIPWAQAHVGAILEAWYPGEQGGAALANILLGRINPSGRLPITFYRKTEDLPAFEDYRMAGRTYRYFDGPVLYPFGFGLSYTRFHYEHARATVGAVENARILVTVDVTNAGSREGDEVVQIYATDLGPERRARESLCAFRRVHLAAGETRRVEIAVGEFPLRRWDVGTNAYFVPDRWKLQVGASSADIRARLNVSLGSRGRAD